MNRKFRHTGIANERVGISTVFEGYFSLFARSSLGVRAKISTAYRSVFFNPFLAISFCSYVVRLENFA